MADDDFTPEQLHVVGLPPQARALVVAPAGTGKTHVLAGRLASLLEHHGLDPGDEVLVLSFSRAAVAELRRRVASLGGDAAYVGSATFDSFASRVLASEFPDSDWLSKGYDERVEAAVERITSDPLPGMLRLARHILVDEIQDLAGRRAALVLTLINRLDCGFTVFGDPAQAIYGYQSVAGDLSTAELFDAIRAADPVFNELTLSEDFRSTVPAKEEIAEIGKALRCPDPHPQVIADEIRSVSLRLPFVELAAARRMLTKPGRGPSAILSRTNGEALRLSRHLFDLGVNHSLQRRGEDKAVGSWLARAVANVSTSKVSAAGLRDALPPESDEDFSRLSLQMRRLDPSRGDGFDLARIANRIRSGDVPEEVNEGAATDVVVSTIHRAKGLEFDRVYLCEWEARPDDDVDEENRLRYVAMTRAKRELFQVRRVDRSGLTVDPRTGRWLRRGFGSSRWRVHELEVLGSDADRTYPARSAEMDERQTQEYILTSVSPGDSVELLRSDGQEPGPQFVIAHAGRIVGATAPEFAEILVAIFGEHRLPTALRDLRVELVDTVAGDARAAVRGGLGAHGLWARVRPAGLASVGFSSTVGEET